MTSGVVVLLFLTVLCGSLGGAFVASAFWYGNDVGRYKFERTLAFVGVVLTIMALLVGYATVYQAGVEAVKAKWAAMREYPK